MLNSNEVSGHDGNVVQKIGEPYMKWK